MPSVHTRLFWTGLILLGCGALTWVLMQIAVNHEMAESPGEKSLGVAVLGIMFGLPLLVFMGSGILALLAGSAVYLWNLWVSRRDPDVTA